MPLISWGCGHPLCDQVTSISGLHPLGKYGRQWSSRISQGCLLQPDAASSAVLAEVVQVNQGFTVMNRSRARRRDWVVHCVLVCFPVIAAARPHLPHLCVPSLPLSLGLATVCAGYSGRNVDSTPLLLRATEYVRCSPISPLHFSPQELQ